MNIRIVAAIVDTRQLTLYKADGETVIIKQGDERLRKLLDQVTPQIVSQGFAEVDLTEITPSSGFEQFEKKSGVIRFFKVAREKLAGLFAPHVAEAAVGKKPGLVADPKVVGEAIHAEAMAEIERKQAAVAEIIANAQPVTGAGFNTDNLVKQGNIVEESGDTDQQRQETKTTHTVVAHVDGKLIPDMERIETQLSRAAKLGSTIGVERFLQRLAAVIDQRSHSVEDLLKFMERADMPIADDGSVIVYKVLSRQGDKYVDCHTKSVPQKVGSFVCMDISLVDRNRNNECSNGLHIARRGYIKSFSGDICTICKLAPEDVVTVPQYDANKMRVMGYHILHELSPELYALLNKNQPITESDEGKELLGNILAGIHTPRLEEVRIVDQRGQGLNGSVVITKITPPAPVVVTQVDASVGVPLIDEINEGRAERGAKLIPKQRAKPAPAEALSNPSQEKKDTPINPKDVVKTVSSLSRKEQAQKLFKAYQKNPSKKNKDKLVAFKKSVKLGWKALGIDEAALK